MQVLADNSVSLAAELQPVATSPTVPSTASNETPKSSSKVIPVNAQPTTAPSLKQEPLLTFRRDTSGRVYYVISDPESGQEIAQVPPEQLRNVSEGIEAYLKEREAKNSENSHIETQA